MEPSKDQLLWMYKKMVTSRYYEESMEKAYMEGKSPLFNMAKGPVPGEMHLSNGQEPCAVGVCVHLRPEDAVTATHRPHHIAIAKGVDLKQMTAEIFGKKTGLSGGRGGHMHLFQQEVNFSCSGIVAQGCGPAVGAALAFQMKKTGNVAVAFVGEGAVNQGAFHESCNLAAVWRLSVIFVIEDNAYAISVPKSKATAVQSNDARAKAYNMRGYFVPDNDPIGVFRAAGEAIEHARKGGGPSIIEIETYRLTGHFIGDDEGYRPKEELDRLRRKDPLPIMKNYLVDRVSLTEEQNETLVSEAKSAVDMAFDYARSSPFPDPEEALEGVFV